MKPFLRTRAGFGWTHLPGAAIVEGPSGESGAVRMPVAWVAMVWALMLFLLTVSSTQADTVLSKDLLYVDSETGGRISAYDTSTLNLLWVTDLSSLVNIDGPLSVSVDKKNVYVGIDAQDGGGLAVLSAATGEVIWFTNLGTPVYSAPTVTKDYLYIGTQTGVWVLQKIDGSIFWVTFVGPVDSSPAVAKDIVYISTSNSGVDTLWALSALTGEILFSTQLN